MTITYSIVEKKFVAPALPVPPIEYDQRYSTDLIRVLRIYFNQLDDLLNQVVGNIDTMGLTDTSFDAFGRLQVSEPYTLFDSQNRYQADPQFDTSLTGSGSTTYLPNESTVQLNVTNASGDAVVRQSYRSLPYQPGKGLQVLATFVMGTAKTNLIQRVGYFNSQNGVFFQRSGALLSFVLRSYISGSASDARTVNQADWNGDKLDGTGASGLTLDLTKAQILWMDFEWLGVGSVRCGFIINGIFYVCHTFNNANDITSVYMTTAILPVRYEISNAALTSGSSSLKQICSTVISEGGYQQKAQLSWARMTSATTVTTAFEPLTSIRLKSTSLGAVVIPAAFSVLPIGSTLDYEVALIKNPTLTGASWASNTTNVERDIAATALTGGTVVSTAFVSGSNQGSGVVSGGGDYNFDLQLGASIAGVSDVYTLAARTISGTDDIIGALSYYDLTD